MGKMSERLRFHGRFATEDRLEAATRKYGEREQAARLLDEAEEALADAMLWTDEEYDVREWRENASAILAKLREAK